MQPRLSLRPSPGYQIACYSLRGVQYPSVKVPNLKCTQKIQVFQESVPLTRPLCYNEGPMNKPTPEVHIYASGLTFVVVPVLNALNGSAVEVTPVYKIPLTLGRPTVFRLARAIRNAREFSENEESTTAARWDGDVGRWWQHHLMLIAIKWEAARVRMMEPDLGEETSVGLPADTAESELAERLIQRLGQRLHGG